jgi:transposase
MGRHGRYTAEFKQKAVALYRRRGTTMAAVARELGVDDGTLSSWVRAADGAEGPVPENPFQRDEELRQLRREVARLREENEILLKASAFFASRRL